MLDRQTDRPRDVLYCLVLPKKKKNFYMSKIIQVEACGIQSSENNMMLCTFPLHLPEMLVHCVERYRKQEAEVNYIFDMHCLFCIIFASLRWILDLKDLGKPSEESAYVRLRRSLQFNCFTSNSEGANRLFAIKSNLRASAKQFKQKIKHRG